MLSLLVIADRADGLIVTMRALDVQSLDRKDYEIRLLLTSAGDGLEARLSSLEGRRPNVTLVKGHADGLAATVRETLQDSGSDLVLPLLIGTELHREALERLAQASSGHAVAGRRSGSDPVLAAPEGLVEHTPLAALLAPASLARDAAAEVAEDEPAQDAAAWLAAWQRAVLRRDADAVQLVDYPSVRADQLGTESLVEVAETELSWQGPRISLNVRLADGLKAEQASFYLHEAESGTEHVFPAGLRQADGDTVLEGSFDPADVAFGHELPAGEWLVGFDLVAGSERLRGRVPNTALTPGIVKGRPVARSLKRRHLALQVGQIKRNFIKADPAAAHIEESVAGTRVRLPLEDLHVAETDVLTGEIFLGGLPVRADIRPSPEGPVLEAWLSGLAGTYPVKARFGHTHRAPTGLTLEVDGVGTMRLSRTPKKAAKPGTAVASSGSAEPPSPLQRLRSAVPDTVAKALGRRGGRDRS